ncbi:MAG: YkvA family protein [Nannocystaceae bacterium]|nr:DUF1232 domain-containing protein [bacterium]
MFEAPDYAAALGRFVHDYTGTRERAVRLAPDVFNFYAKLLVDGRLSKDARTIVTSVLAYFVVPDDVLPEADLGPLGLMDDLYAAAYGFRMLRREVRGEVLVDAWTGDDVLEDAMAVVYTQTRAELGKKTKEVLQMAGLG